ncbi:MAG: molybdopterin-guanine dinucleotide biosynthesis protein B [Candidatus Bathyarchaeota archaeon]|nr:molybdopterin-guanine dinucleotide biosynthesis protein B [Candidatus Bathyarchaeota archaeon]
MPKLVAVVGAKHSGKTTVIEHLTAELKRRGYHVGVIKEMVRIARVDTPAKETDRYALAGAEAVVAVPREETVVFIKRRLSVKEILPHLGGMDFVVLEGFESEDAIPQIVAAKTSLEAQSYPADRAIAVSGIIADSNEEAAKAQSLKIPLFSSFREIEKLADTVEHKAAVFS